jgi:ribosomal protein S18 acetylase RimI-like enzyme
MLLFKRITQADELALGEIKPLYENTFPQYERRTWDALLKLLAEPKMSLNTIISDQQFIGFVIYWKLEEWLYIEHFAIIPGMRGQQLGTGVIQLLLAEAGGKLILETEPAITGEAIRRIEFYQKLGLEVINHPYNQPAYRSEEKPFPMLLMTSLYLGQQECERVTGLIKQEVYERFLN